MLARLRDWSRRAAAALPALLPCACAICGGDGSAALCGTCRRRYLAANCERCPCCALVQRGRCGSCLAHPPAFDATIAAVDYSPPLDQLVLALKFGARLELAPLLADMMHEAVRRDAGSTLALLIPVPLGPQRLVERGFNQALEIARPLGRALGVPVVPDLLWRVRDTEAQSQLHPDARRRNVGGAFSVRHCDDVRLDGLHVGLVDDVMTTGETMQSATVALKRSGAARVSCLVFARTLPA